MSSRGSGKRGDGEGSIRQRSTGGWEARFRTPDGKQDSVYGKTRREVQDKLRTVQRDQANGLDLGRGRQTLGVFLDAWLGEAKRRLRPKTYTTYEHIVRVHLKPHLGRHSLVNLGPQHVQEFLNRQSLTGLS